MRRIWLLPVLLLLFTLSACVVEPEAVENHPVAESDWSAAFATYVEETMTAEGIPGVGLALVQGTETILAQGFGLGGVAAQTPITPETLFHIGSTHKSMTAMLIATLVDDDILGWDEPVVAYAPAFGLSDPTATETVTIRHLLSMTSGIPDDAEDDMPDDAQAEEALEIIWDTPLLGEPGEAFSYSNLSTSAAGYVGALAANPGADDLFAAYADLLQTRILDPIGMESATIYASRAQANPNYAKSYVLSGQGAPVLAERFDVDGDALAPSGSLKANVTEMALYVATQLNQGVAPNGNRVVSAQNLAQTWQPYLEDYALGWEVQSHAGVKVIAHTGAFDDFASVIGFIPDYNVGFVILLNSESAGEELIENAPAKLVTLLGSE